MRPFIEVGVIIAACGSAMFWFRSAMCRLPSVKPSTDEVGTVGTVAELSKALQRMNRSNFWAAGLMGVAALLSVLGRVLGHLAS